MDSGSARKLIERCFPEIRVRRVRRILTGWENFVLEVNGEYVFRFPKFKETETRLKTEIRLLAKLQGKLSAPVPNYVFVWKGSPGYRHWFGGYPKLQGVTMTKKTLRREAIRQLGQQISNFLRELQRARSLVRGVAIPRYSKKEWLESQHGHYDKIRRIVYPLLDARVRERSKLFWRDLLEAVGDADYQPTLLHGDLSSENILFDPKTWKMTGVLDWGYAQVSDPGLELAHLFLHKREVGEEVLKMYRPFDPEFEQRVEWYVRSEPFFDIMWGVTHKWERAVRLGLRNVGKSLEGVE